MVKNKMSLTGYSEEFDMERLREIADMSMRDAVHTICGRNIVVNGQRCPDGSFSDFECNVWSLMNQVILFGIELRELGGKMGEDVPIESKIEAFEDFRFLNPIEHDISLRE